MASVYGVVDATGQVRYIGQCVGSIEDRFARHLRDARREAVTPFPRWLLKHEHEARVVLLETVEDRADLNAREIAWIAHYGLANLLNVSAGGNGGNVPGGVSSPEYVMSGKHRAAMSSPERLAKWRAAREATGWKRTVDQSPEAKARRSAASKKAIETRRNRVQLP